MADTDLPKSPRAAGIVTPSELHDYVVARWTDRRALAQAADPGPWTVRTASMGVRPHRGTPLGHSVYAWVLGPDGAPIVERHNGGTVEDLDHVAANDPTHVIAVCDAALRRLARHAPIAFGRACGSCTDERHNPIRYPCPEALDDAAPFADRPDFPEELRRRD